MVVRCNNRLCLYRDCELRYSPKALKRPGRSVTVLDLQISHRRLAEHIATEINKENQKGGD